MPGSDKGASMSGFLVFWWVRDLEGIDAPSAPRKAHQSSFFVGFNPRQAGDHQDYFD